MAFSLITGTDASRMTAGVVSKAGNALLDKARLFDRGGVLPPGLTLACNDTGRDEQYPDRRAAICCRVRTPCHRHRHR